MRRREFITLLGAAATCPLAAPAQQPAMPIVGLLSLGTSRSNQASEMGAALRAGLNEAGYIEGRNVAIEGRWAEGRVDQLPELAADLVQRRVAVITTPGSTPGALAAKAATKTIPIVFSIAGDPVELGLVAGLARPGGNITGFAEMNAEVLSKRLEILHELLPSATRFALLTHSSVPVAASYVTSLKAGASINDWQVEVRNLAGSLKETDAILETEFVGLVQKQIDGLLISPGGVFFNLRRQLASLSVRYKIPTIYWDRGLVEAGGLISYGSNIVDQFRRVGVYAGRILKGEKPAEMPIQLPTKFELVINLKTAKALGLEVPWFLQQRADEVVE